MEQGFLFRSFFFPHRCKFRDHRGSFQLSIVKGYDTFEFWDLQRPRDERKYSEMIRSLHLTYLVKPNWEFYHMFIGLVMRGKMRLNLSRGKSSETKGLKGGVCPADAPTLMLSSNLLPKSNPVTLTMPSMYPTHIDWRDTWPDERVAYQDRSIALHGIRKSFPVSEDSCPIICSMIKPSKRLNVWRMISTLIGRLRLRIQGRKFLITRSFYMADAHRSAPEFYNGVLLFEMANLPSGGIWGRRFTCVCAVNMIDEFASICLFFFVFLSPRGSWAFELPGKQGRSWIFVGSWRCCTVPLPLDFLFPMIFPPKRISVPPPVSVF